jgi:hypothetical protein
MSEPSDLGRLVGLLLAAGILSWCLSYGSGADGSGASPVVPIRLGRTLMQQLRFLPERGGFFAYFRHAAANAAVAARLLTDLFARHEDPAQAAERLHDLEHQGDAITNEVFTALSRNLIAPLSYEDIRTLARELDDFIDDIDAVGQRLILYRLFPVPEPALRLVRIVDAQAGILVAAFSLLHLWTRCAGANSTGCWKTPRIGPRRSQTRCKGLWSSSSNTSHCGLLTERVVPRSAGSSDVHYRPYDVDHFLFCDDSSSLQGCLAADGAAMLRVR